MTGEQALQAVVPEYVGNRSLPQNAISGAGRPTGEQAHFRDVVKERMERKLLRAADRVLKTYLGLAAGEVIKRGKRSYTLQVDPATTRHAVDRLIPPVQEIAYSGGVTVRIVRYGMSDPAEGE